MKNISIIFTFLFLGVLFFAGCSSNEASPTETEESEMTSEESSDEISVTQNQFDLAKMKLGQFSVQGFPSSIRANGRVEIPSKNQMRVSSYAGGYVTSIGLITGEKVKRGQILFTLENPDFVEMQQEYLEAKEQLTYLQSDYERQKTLASENIASQKNFLKAESEYRVTLAKMEGMKKRLSLLKINTDNLSSHNMVSSISVYAPASGYITKVNAMKGMFLNPTDVGVEMVNYDEVYIELDVFEKDILKVKKGQTIEFKIPDASEETFEAKIHLIGKSIDPEKRVVRVHANLKNKKDKSILVSGMYVSAEIVTESASAKGLPESAIVTEDEQNFVLIEKVKTGDTYSFEKRSVTVGQRQNGFAEIINSDDFSETEKILIDGGFNLIGIE